MDKVYNQKENEGKWYKFWEQSGFFTPKIDPSKKPYTILLPLPNANDPIHVGHAMFTIQDILIRYHRMLQEPTLWLPGADHAGIETQYVFEKALAKEGKSRFDFDRETLYKMIEEFVEKNKNINRDQLKRLGFSLDWTRYHYSLEPQIVEKVLETFKKLHDDGLVYRGERIVNFCTKCGTAFSNLEIEFEERKDNLYYLNFGPITIATTRPETIFADVAVAVNPEDKRYKKLIGQKAVLPLIDVEIPIVAASEIDMKFGTGALKVTPGYDPVDFEIGQRNSFETIIVIDRQGRMVNHPRVPKELVDLKVSQAREKTVELLKAAGKLVKEEPLVHSVGACYRCKTTIEPMVIPQWYVKTKTLAEAAIKAVKTGKTKIVPHKRFEKMYFDWMENILDWNISRQIVWGPRIPVWYKIDRTASNIWVYWIDKDKSLQQNNLRYFLEKGVSLNDIKNGLQRVEALSGLSGPDYIVSLEEPKDGEYIQETDTFDTWFLSSQWLLTTLGYPDSPDFKYFYPTSVLDTLWDILFFWVARMMMFGLYLAHDVPFHTIHLHARVVDKFGQKMSKSKGNVLNPIEMVEKYGADALRMALVVGVAPAADVHLSEDKIRAMRNFTNKLWNIGRYIIDFKPEGTLALDPVTKPESSDPEDKKILKALDELTKKVTKSIEAYRFNDASEALYEFIWHQFADVYIEKSKARRAEAQPVLEYVLKTSLELLHPFMPYITEELWQKLPHEGKSIMVSNWPKAL